MTLIALKIESLISTWNVELIGKVDTLKMHYRFECDP